jgi:Domain of unknown function (DUF4385)
MKAADPTASEPVDFRAHPERYRIGKGERGVLTVQPYKGEILPHWRFRTPELARRSAAAIFGLFLGYKAAGDFVGMDLSRKFLRMGYTRARRYASHQSGRKYAPGGEAVLPPEPDPVKAASAEVFREAWQRAMAEPEYRRLGERHRERYESPRPRSDRREVARGE